MGLPKAPKQFEFGGGDLVELDYLCQVFGIKRRTASAYLKALRITPMCIGGDVYFSKQTFHRIMYVLSCPGAPGFLFPGSKGKNNLRFRKDPTYITEITDELLEQASDPKILAEMAAASGSRPDILKGFLKRPVGRPRKDESE